MTGSVSPTVVSLFKTADWSTEKRSVASLNGRAGPDWVVVNENKKESGKEERERRAGKTDRKIIKSFLNWCLLDSV